MKGPSIYLLRLGEVTLKGKNRSEFINDMVRTIKARMKPLGGRVEKRHKKLLLHCEAPMEQVRRGLATVFGLVSISPIWRTTHELHKICEVAHNLMEPYRESGQTFAVRVRRSLKTYPLNSIQLAKAVAERLLGDGLNLPVNLSHPQLSLGIIIEFQETWLHVETWPGLGGLPIRPSDRFGLLLSGGIDSPVAGHLMQKRGAWINAIYFHTPPYTVEAAKEKVIDLASVLAQYQNRLWLHIVNFTEIMQTLLAGCKSGYTVILSRRAMIRAANQIMADLGGKGLITGESLGQVASQTIENIGVVNTSSLLPVLRPLISMDKNDIMATAKRMGTFDISIRPFMDCCSLFAPKEPITRAKLHLVEREEAKVNLTPLLERALLDVEIIRLSPDLG